MDIINSGGHCAVSDLVVTKTYFALQHHYKLPKSEAISALAAMSVENGFVFSPAAVTLLQKHNLGRANPGFADRLIHAEYHASSFPMLSCELTAAKLPQVEVIAGAKVN
ncbi:hypothetical protein [Ereboglobus luteus]|uniref:Uncharacterized protein n=1 Tax=Ereboglobus luteus TaxID=1796921 RepID=A0A2U8E4C2_9BACT|nr:hypothetical protein [Ereboglobus luteus]AWI09727.1 hypothetical protein CKA38_11110 [Ereboglobus luteus]